MFPILYLITHYSVRENKIGNEVEILSRGCISNASIAQAGEYTFIFVELISPILLPRRAPSRRMRPISTFTCSQNIAQMGNAIQSILLEVGILEL